MTRVSASNVTAVFGPLDDDLVARIVETGPSEAELLQAKAWMAADYYMGPEGKPPPQGRVRELCELVEAAEARSPIDDETELPPTG